MSQNGRNLSLEKTTNGFGLSKRSMIQRRFSGVCAAWVVSHGLSNPTESFAKPFEEGTGCGKLVSVRAIIVCVFKFPVPQILCERYLGDSEEG
jgi:hypothetical protein